MGTLPAQALGTAGEAAEFGLAGMVASQNFRATQEALASDRESVGEANKNRILALKELAAGRPAAAQQFLTQLQANNANARNIAMSLIAARQQFGLNQGNERATNAARDARAAAKLARQREALAIKMAKAEGRQIDEAMSFARKIYVDKMGRPILDENGATIPWRKPVSTSGSTTKGGVEQQWDSPAQKWEAIDQSLDNYIKNSFVGNTEVRSKQQAIKYLLAKYPGTSPQKIKALVNASWPKIPQNPGATQGGSVTGPQP